MREAKGGQTEEEPGTESGGGCGSVRSTGAGGACLAGRGGSRIIGGAPVQFECVMKDSMIALPMVHRLKWWKVY